MPDTPPRATPRDRTPPPEAAAALPVSVRPATPADAETMLTLIRALADYEKLDPPDADACGRLVHDAFGPSPRFNVLLAEIAAAGPAPGEPSECPDPKATPGGDVFLSSMIPAAAALENADPTTPIVVGYAFMFETYSTFLALPTLYLEDLFVLPEHRKRGAGSALFRAVVAEAGRRGCGRVEWVVLDWNMLARNFYHRVGARHLDDWCYYRLTRDRFDAVPAL